MELESWDIDRFPLKHAAPKKTPGQEAAERFLRVVTPDDIERLIREDRDTSHGNMVGAETGSPVHVRNEHMDSEYPEEGYNRPDRTYEDETGQYGHRPGEEHPELQGEYTLQDPRRYQFEPSVLFGSLADDEGDEYDEPDEPEWTTYHAGIRRRGTEEEPHEVRVHRLENPYEHETEETWNQFMHEYPENFHENNPNRSHDIVYMHPESDHDRWRADLDEEEQQFRRIAPHGLRRESDIMGHRAYRMEEPNGVVHRLWHSVYSSNGPGWHTSRYDPALDREHQPTPWTEHPDSASEDSLGEALDQVERHKAMTR